MHFPIIAIEEMCTDKSMFRTSLPEDTTLESATNYYDEKYSSKRRKEKLSADWFKKLFDGIATIDTEKETITFLDEDTILSTLKEYFIERTKELHELACKGEIDVWIFKSASSEYKSCSAMFFFNGCGWTSLEFVNEAKYYANQTFKIGNIFDAHC